MSEPNNHQKSKKRSLSPIDGDTSNSLFPNTKKHKPNFIAATASLHSFRQLRTDYNTQANNVIKLQRMVAFHKHGAEIYKQEANTWKARYEYVLSQLKEIYNASKSLRTSQISTGMISTPSRIDQHCVSHSSSVDLPQSSDTPSNPTSHSPSADNTTVCTHFVNSVLFNV